MVEKLDDAPAREPRECERGRKLLMWKLPLRRQLKRLAVLLAGAYLVALVLSQCCVDRLMYWPGESSYSDGPEIIKLTTVDGTAISARWFDGPGAELTVLYSHGNGEDMGDLEGIYQLIADAGLNVLAYDYHGYGTSGGRPSEQATYADIDAAYEYLLVQRSIPPQRIILLGRSIGGGVATDLAARKPVGGLILESAFTSAWRVATHWPIFPRDRYTSIHKLPKVRCPVLVIHGGDDRLSRPWHGRRLFEIANEPKRCLWIAGAGHNDAALKAPREYLAALKDFGGLILARQQAGRNDQ